MGLYYFHNNTKEPKFFLETRGAGPTTTYTKKKVMYVFLKTNIILDPKFIYRDRYNIEYIKVPKELVSTYYFGGGLLLYNALGQVRMLVPKPSIQSLPKEVSRKTMSKNGRDPTPTSHKVPLPTSTTKVGEG